jgi:CRP/FNR family transcriptional regulator, transcriptional activator FtrB
VQSARADNIGDSSRPGAELLRTVPPFDRLDPRPLSRLDAISEIRRFDPHTELCTQGELPAALHFLLEGQVALSGAAPDGAQAVMEVVRPGPSASFVLAAVLTDQPYLMSATTITEAQIVMIRAPALRALIRTEPEIALALLGTVARDFRAMVRQVRDLKLRTATQRLGCYLLALASDPAATSARLRLPFDKALLAGRLGCRQDSLSRAFAMLRELGVETHGAAVILHDIPRLKAYALPDELSDGTPG